MGRVIGGQRYIKQNKIFKKDFFLYCTNINFLFKIKYIYI